MQKLAMLATLVSLCLLPMPTRADEPGRLIRGFLGWSKRAQPPIDQQGGYGLELGFKLSPQFGLGASYATWRPLYDTSGTVNGFAYENHSTESLTALEETFYLDSILPGLRAGFVTGVAQFTSETEPLADCSNDTYGDGGTLCGARGKRGFSLGGRIGWDYRWGDFVVGPEVQFNKIFYVSTTVWLYGVTAGYWF